MHRSIKSTLYVFSEQGKKCISLKSRQHECPNWATAECVKKASSQTSGQVLDRPRRHVFMALGGMTGRCRSYS